jgi:hypothetical protein
MAGCAQQQLAHASLPARALLGDEQELAGGQADALGLGPDQGRPGQEVGAGEGSRNLVGETLGR